MLKKYFSIKIKKWSSGYRLMLLLLQQPWCWERLKARGEGDDRGWGGWMASLTQWTWVWASSRSWWWTGRPGVLHSRGSQRVGHDWETELNWTEYLMIFFLFFKSGHSLFISSGKRNIFWLQFCIMLLFQLSF